MPTCQGCGFTYEDIAQGCPYCKRPNHLLREKPSVGYSCPKCQSMGRKLSSIQDTDVTKSESTIPVSHSYSDDKGRVHSYTSYEKATNISKSGLAEMFSAPVKPVPQGAGCLLGFLRGACWLGIISFGFGAVSGVVGMAAIFFTLLMNFGSINLADAILTIFVTGVSVAVSAAIVFGLFKLQAIITNKIKAESEKGQAEYQVALKAWQPRLDRWKAAFYCANCETLYIPGEGWHQPKEQYQPFLSGPPI